MSKASKIAQMPNLQSIVRFKSSVATKVVALLAGRSACSKSQGKSFRLWEINWGKINCAERLPSSYV